MDPAAAGGRSHEEILRDQGIVIRTIAKSRRMSARELGAALDPPLSEPQMSKRLRGQSEFRSSELLKVAEVLGVPVDLLYSPPDDLFNNARYRAAMSISSRNPGRPLTVVASVPGPGQRGGGSG